MNDKLIINLVPGDTFLHKLSGASKTRMFAVLIVVTIMTFDVRIMIPLLVLSLIAFFSVKPDWKQKRNHDAHIKGHNGDHDQHCKHSGLAGAGEFMQEGITGDEVNNQLIIHSLPRLSVSIK